MLKIDEINVVRSNILQRRSIFPRSFTTEPVTTEEIELLMEAANSAPTHRLTQPWRFKIVRGSALPRLRDFMVRKYQELTPANLFSNLKETKIRRKITACQVVILICMQRDPMESVPEWEEIASLACSVQNLWLMATSLGIGGYWSTPTSIQYMHEFTSMKPGERCLGLFYLGRHDAPEIDTKKSSWKHKVSWIDS